MNLPASFIDQTRALLGNEEYEKLVLALQQAPPVSIRLNPKHAFTDHLHSIFVNIPWADKGRYLEERLTFTFDPLFHAGCYYVQEASSMFVEQVIRQYVTQPIRILDVCAAPGGKSTHLRSVLPEGSLLVANEVIRSRSHILAENLTKWGHPDVVVTNNDPSDFSDLPLSFDVILADVPCSGEGMFRKDPTAIAEWSLENVEICRQRQRRIVTDVWRCLKPGGILIYSTCTYNTKENEENIRWIRQALGAESLPLKVPAEWHITGNLLPGDDTFVCRFLPHQTKGEGFFLAVLGKPRGEKDADEEICASQLTLTRKKNKKRGAEVSAVSKEHLAVAESWLSNEPSGTYDLWAEGTNIAVFPRLYANDRMLLKERLKVLQAGLMLGEVKGKDLIPAHALAMSRSLLRQEAFVTQEIAYEQAIAYLRKEAVTLPATVSRGYVLLTYRDTPLGFVKNIGNRSNNLYPSEWRIRSGYLPEEIKTL